MEARTPALESFRAHIDGQWVDAASGQTFESFNAYTGKPWALAPRCGAEDVERAVQAAHRAFTGGSRRARSG